MSMAKFKNAVFRLLPFAEKIYNGYRTRKILGRLEREVGFKIPPLAREERGEIDALYAKYGLRTDDRYFIQYAEFYNVTGLRLPYFIDDSIRDKILERLNRRSLSLAWEDKSYIDKIACGVKTPDTVIRNINRVFFDHDYKEVSKERAFEILNEHERLLAKPSLDSGSGAGVRIYSKLEFSEIFKTYGKDFVVQKVIEQHPVLAAFNPSSVNTFRIMSWRFNGETHIMASVMRVGKEGSNTDNLCGGGAAFKVFGGGRMEAYGYRKHGLKTDNAYVRKMAEKDEKLPSYDKVIDAIKNLHPRLPHFGIIAWDFAVDKEGAPVLMEYNLNEPGLTLQFSNGPVFGDYWEPIMEEYARRKPHV